MAFRIRPAVPSDAAALAEMIVAISAEGDEPHHVMTAAEVLHDGFGTDPAFRALVAEAEEPAGLLGYALFYPIYSPEFAVRGLLMHGLYTRPAHRSQGIGRALIAGVARAALHGGFGFVYWTSDEYNPRAQKLYDAVSAKALTIREHFLAGPTLSALAGGRPAR
jgi:GNAT superfamily N-acetyltransferase